MRGKRKIVSILTVLSLLVMVFGIIPTQKVQAASYPSVFMYEDSEFKNLCASRTIECGTNTQLYFEWFRAYNHEKYSIEIFDSSNLLVASTEGIPPVSSIGHITIDWDTSDYAAGDYTIKVHKFFYSFYSWHESPSPSTYWITLTRPCTHTWDDGTVTTAPTCISKGTKHYTCTLCGETRDEEMPIVQHTWDDGTVTTAPTVFKNGVKTYTCTTCNNVKTKKIAKLKPTIKLSVTKKTLKKGKTFKLSVSKLATGDSIKSVKTSNKKIATVKKNGKKYVVSAKKAGQAKIIVSLKSGKKATCIITVK